MIMCESSVESLQSNLAKHREALEETQTLIEKYYVDKNQYLLITALGTIQKTLIAETLNEENNEKES